MFNSNRYETIIKLVCDVKGISKEEFFKILDDKECKYLMLLLMKKYNCLDEKLLREQLNISNKRVINYNANKARERFFINSSFREEYFQLEEILAKSISAKEN